VTAARRAPGSGPRPITSPDVRGLEVAPTDDITAACIAFEAGQLLLSLRERPDSAVSADVRSNELIVARLRQSFPGDAVLSEEAPDSAERLAAARTWIVDPLDGTREYGEPGREDWAVHVALVVGHELRAGAVALPASGMLFSTSAPLPTRLRREGPPRLAVSRTRPPPVAAAVAAALGAELVPLGSAGAKTMAVVRGEVDAYLHAGGQYEWDSAAPVAVAVANGLHASRVDGSELRWNQPSPWLPDLLVCRPELAPRLLDALASVGAS